MASNSKMRKCVCGSICAILLTLNSNIAAQGNALNFDGSNDKVDISHSSSLNFGINDKFSIEAWFRTTASNYRIIFSKLVNSSPYRGYELILANGQVDFSFTSDYFANNYIKVMTVNSFNDGIWHHVAAVYKGIPNGNNIDIYVDGVLQNKSVLQNSLSGIATNTNMATIAARQGVNAYNFQGPLDEVRIWNKALCAQEITAMRNCQLTGNEYGLVAYYNFNQGTAGSNNSTVTILPDLTSYNNTGTLTSFALTGSVSNWVASSASVSGTCSQYGSLAISGNTALCAAPTLTTVLSASGASTYTWSVSGNTNTSISVSPVSTTIYSVVATYSNNCIEARSVTVAVNPNPTVTAVASATSICNGQTATVIANGAATYTWSNGALTQGTTVSPSVSTSYSVTGTSSMGCVSNIFTQNILVNPVPVINVNSGSVCSGNSFTIAPAGASTYTYSGGTNVVSPAGTTIYSVTGTNSTGCVSSVAQSTVTVLPLPVISIAGPTVIGCNSGAQTLTASGASTYTWNQGSQGSMLVINPGSNTVYSVTGTDASGCSNTAQTSVSVSSMPVISINGNTVLCKGNSTSLLVNGSATTYSWNTGATSNLINVTPLVTTVYTVTGSAPGGCTGTATVMVQVNNLPVVAAIASNTLVCSGSPVVLAGTGASTYSWSGGISDNTPFNPQVTTVFTVTGIDANGCKNYSTVLISVLPSPTLAVTGTPTICAGETITLTANGANGYTWNNGSNTSQITVTPLVTTNYTVTGTDNNGCADTEVLMVNVSTCTGLTGHTTQMLEIYPNPVSGRLYLHTGSAARLPVMIIDAAGRHIETVLPDADNSINMQKYSKGIYLIRIEEAGVPVKQARVVVE
jgi:hypothetical protein